MPRSCDEILTHLHSFELGDGRPVGYPEDSFASEPVWVDHAKLKVAKRGQAGGGVRVRHRSRRYPAAPLYRRAGEERFAGEVRDHARGAGGDLGLGFDR